MGDGKRLAKETLEECLSFLGDKGPENGELPHLAAALRGHVAALEAELYKAGIAPGAHSREVDAVAIRATQNGMAERISDLEKSLGDVVADRDAALAELKGVKERLVSCEAAVETARKERDDALKPSGQVAEDEALLVHELEQGGADYEPHLAALSRLAAKAHGHEAFAAACREALGPHRYTGTPADVALLHRDREAARAFSVQFGQERDAAVADNAALVRCRDLFERLARAARTPRDEQEALWREVYDFLHDTSGPHPGTALLEQHRKEVVRARNEGLEKAASKLLNAQRGAERMLTICAADSLAHRDWEQARRCYADMREVIVAMKESEQ